MINPKLRRSYDLRGVVGDTLRSDDARALGQVFATIGHRRGLTRIAVSCDGRLSSPELEAALVGGLVAGGATVFRMPRGPTPLVSYTVNRLELDGGIMVTGSHNPPDQNGFKLLLGGHPVHGAALSQLWGIEPEERVGGSFQEVDESEAYLDALTAELAGLPVAKAAWDSGNGATGELMERLVGRLGDGHILLFNDIDGTFPNHHPDPSVAANLDDLSRCVREEGQDLGIAFDGDGDRIGVVDGTGEIVWADQLLLLLACDVLADQPGATVIGDVKSSSVLFDGVAAAGGRPLMSPSGYVLVREAMLRERAPLAGEMSGHIFFADRWHCADDGLYNAVRTLRALARSGQSLEQFRRSLPVTFATPEVRLGCPDDRKAPVLQAIAADVRASGGKIDATDGLRVAEDGGWWLLRASGTEPKLTARCEAQDPDTLDRISGGLARRLEQHGLDPAGLRSPYSAAT